MAEDGVRDTDALIVGAGPVGLWQAFQLGLQEVRCELVDSLPHAGGQCSALYPDKPLYDIPGLPRCTGRELATRLLAQLEPLRVPLHLGHELQSLARHPARGDTPAFFELQSSRGLRWRCRVLVIAAGTGSFQPRALKVPGLEAYLPSDRLAHHLPPDLSGFAGLHVVVAGGEELALGMALRLADEAPGNTRITLLHRREVFAAGADTLERFERHRAAGRIGFVAGQPVAAIAQAGSLAGLELATPAGGTEPLRFDRLVVGLGLSPRLGPLADWGLALEKRQLPVDPARFETSEPGVFAVGDVNHYPGKKKLIVCGFHEATLAAFAIGERLHGGPPGPLEYTTSSSRLQRLLGVAPAAASQR